MKRKRGAEHISETAPAHIRSELNRSLLGRFLSRGAMEIKQHEIAAREVRRDPRLSLNPRAEALTKPGDPRKLRGIPIQAHGIGGTINGTNPLGELLQRHGEWTPAPADDEGATLDDEEA